MLDEKGSSSSLQGRLRSQASTRSDDALRVRCSGMLLSFCLPKLPGHARLCPYCGSFINTFDAYDRRAVYGV